VTLTPRQLNRSTLGRQLLLRREPVGVVEAVRRVMALQAQEPASPYVALWNRVEDLDPAELDHAFAEQSIVKATLMRITLHVVHAEDHPAFHEAMQPSLRGARLNDRRFTAAGLSAAEADALVPHLLEHAARPRTKAELEVWLDERIGPRPGPGVWWLLRSFAPLVHAPSGGPWWFGRRPCYVAALRQQRSGDPEVSLRWLVGRYLEGYGPASVQDVARFALVRRSRARAALASLALDGAVERLEGPNGVELFDVADGRLPPEDAPAPPRLMAMWDNTLLAYADGSRIVPPEYRALVTRVNGDVLPTLLVDGSVAGVWRPVEDGIEATAFHPLRDEAWEGLEAEARGLVAFLADREPMVYRRNGHWWDGLPRAEVRVLARD
jgi:Winged helix DNA-binding domain